MLGGGSGPIGARRRWHMVPILLATAGLLDAAGPPPARPQEGPEVVYRSPAFERTTGGPNVHRAVFEACDPDGRFRLVLDNGVEEGRRVSSGSVWLNGRAVVVERDLSQQVAQVVRQVTLAPVNTLEVRLAGAPGGRVRVTVDGVMSCLRVRITTPRTGASLVEPGTVVEGELETRRPAGVRLFLGVPVRDQWLEFHTPVELNGRRFAAWVALPRGPVRLRALASDDAGRTAEDSVRVTFEPDPPENDRPVQPEVSPTVGFAPLTVTFEGRAATDPDVDLLDLDADGDGQADVRLPDFAAPPHRVTYTYRVEGLYVATYVARERVTGRTATARVPVNVIPAPDLPAIWNGFRAALGRGDVDGASRFVAHEARQRYRRVFEDLRADLPAFASTLQDLTPVVVRAEYATATATRLADGQREGFIVHFVRDVDGVWRIAAM
jgi:hypothetical protein